MSAMTVGELKEALLKYPDNYILVVECIEYNSIGEIEILSDIEVTNIVKIDGACALAFKTKGNLIEEGAARSMSEKIKSF